MNNPDLILLQRINWQKNLGPDLSVPTPVNPGSGPLASAFLLKAKASWIPRLQRYWPRFCITQQQVTWVPFHARSTTAQRRHLTRYSAQVRCIMGSVQLYGNLHGKMWIPKNLLKKKIFQRFGNICVIQQLTDCSFWKQKSIFTHQSRATWKIGPKRSLLQMPEPCVSCASPSRVQSVQVGRIWNESFLKKADILLLSNRDNCLTGFQPTFNFSVSQH